MCVESMRKVRRYTSLWLGLTLAKTGDTSWDDVKDEGLKEAVRRGLVISSPPNRCHQRVTSLRKNPTTHDRSNPSLNNILDLYNIYGPTVAPKKNKQGSQKEYKIIF